MGRTNSHGIEKSVIEHPFASIEKTVIPLTEDQITIVRETWDIIEPHKKEIGVNVYVRWDEFCHNCMWPLDVILRVKLEVKASIVNTP